MLNLASSYRYKASSREARNMEDSILEKATRTQSLLESSMPPMIARSLLAGTPAYELTRTSPCASVAFIELVDCAFSDDSGGSTEVGVCLCECVVPSYEYCAISVSLQISISGRQTAFLYCVVAYVVFVLLNTNFVLCNS